MEPGRRGQRGQAIMEMAVVLPLLALLVAASLAFGPLVYLQLAVQQVSYDCALASAQSLDPAQGYLQGVYAAERSLEGFNLNRARAEVSLRGSWERGGAVLCSVDYRVPTGAFPFHGVIELPARMSHAVTLPVQAGKSVWQ